MKVGVLIPNYNDAPYIAEAIQCVLDQTRRPDEFIVVDDASTDNSVEIISGFEGLRGLRLCRAVMNNGVIKTVNAALADMTCDAVVILSANDILYSDFLAKSELALDAAPKAAFSCSNPVYFTGASKGATFLTSDVAPSSGYYGPNAISQIIQRGEFRLSALSGLIRRDLLLGIGGLHEPAKWHSDWLAWHLLALRHGCAAIRENLAATRMIEGSYYHKGRNGPENEAAVKAVGEFLSRPECVREKWKFEVYGLRAA